MMQMLAAGGVPVLIDGERPPDEDNPRGYFEFDPVKRTRRDPAWLAAARGRAVKIVHLLLYDLPAGYAFRIIFMMRKIEEVLASQRAMLHRMGKPGARLSDAQLARIFQGQLEKVAKWLRQRPDISVLDVHYNDLIVDPARSIEAIQSFLGCPLLDAAAMARAVDPALYRQRQ